MSARGQKLRLELTSFLRQYARRASPGHDPNDRRYDRKIEALVKRMRPEELDALIRGDDRDDDSGSAPPPPPPSYSRGP